MVAFKDAKPDKKNYRKFKIKTFMGQDDFASMNEVVTRRYKRQLEEKEQLPDLVDDRWRPRTGSRSQNGARKAWAKVAADWVAKEREEIYLPDDPTPKLSTKTAA